MTITPHSNLARLNLPVYITTNYDNFMEYAIRKRGKIPTSEFCRWNNHTMATGIPSVFDDQKYKPSKSSPLVYHLHGTMDTPQSMILTESDYIEFMINIKDDNTSIIPPIIRQILAGTTILFIGYSLKILIFQLWIVVS